MSDSLARHIISESNHANVHQNFVDAHSVYKLNGTTTYLKNILSANVSFPKGDGTINNLIQQKFSAHSINIDDFLKINYRRHNGGIADASFRIIYKDKRGLLTLSNSKFCQIVDQRNLKIDGTGSLIALSIPRFMFNLNGEMDATWQQTNTNLDISIQSIPGEQQTWQIGARITPKLFWHYGQKFQWLIYVPVGFLHYNSNNQTWNYDKTFCSIRPYSNIIYKYSDRLSFSFTTISDESLPSAISLMAEKRFIDYRTTISNPEHIKATMNRTLKSSFNVSYANVLEMLFSSLVLTFAQSRNSNSSGYFITEDIINYIRLPYSTDNRVWQLDQTFSKGFFLWNSKFDESFSTGVNNCEYYINDEMHEGKSKYLRVKFSYNASFTKWLSLNTSNEFSLSKSYADGKANSGIKHTFVDATSIGVWPCKQLNVATSVMYYNNNYSSSYRNNVFLNCDIEYGLRNIILYVQCSNLLNNDVFRRFNDNGVIRYSSEYRLRGRTIMIGFKIRIT